VQDPWLLGEYFPALHEVQAVDDTVA